MSSYFGGVEENCKTGGQWYELACGPNSAWANSMPDSLWRTTYVQHRNYSEEHQQNYAAAYFAQRSRETGGQGSSTGYAFQAMADAWYNRDIVLPVEDQSCKMYRTACETMRNQRDGLADTGPSYVDYPEGSLWLCSAFVAIQSADASLSD
eukprot:4557567-Prymnesium_polylepis.1